MLPREAQEAIRKIDKEPQPPTKFRPPIEQKRQVHLADVQVDDVFFDANTLETPVADSTAISNDYFDDERQESTDESTKILAHIANRKKLPPGDIRRVLAANHIPKTSIESSKGKPSSSSLEMKKAIVIDGKTYIQASMHHVQAKYSISAGNVQSFNQESSLSDRGASGGLLGSDSRFLESTDRFADVVGVGAHEIKDLRIGTGAALCQSLNHGPVILIINQYAHLGKGKTIHSCGQLEHFGNKVDDRSKRVGGKQLIVSHDGYAIPLSVRGGLAYLDMRPCTDEEMDEYPHVILTSDSEWNPTVLDQEADDMDWFDALQDIEDGSPSRFDLQGNYRKQQIVHELQFLELMGRLETLKM